MSGQWVFIEAADVWLFRDNKPFTAQQNFVARGQFPPIPMTMQGAVRTYYLENHLQREGRNWDDYRRGKVSDTIVRAVGLPAFDGRSATVGDLKMMGPFVARMANGKLERLLPAPLDLLAQKIENTDPPNFRYRLLTPADGHDFYTDVPFAGWRPLAGGGADYKEAHGWLTETQFEQYLRGKVSHLSDLPGDDSVFQIEDRVGLALDYGRRANAEGMFYHAEFVRPCEQVGLLIYVSPAVFESETGYLNLGGESRSGHFQLVSGVTPLPQAGRGKVKIVLLSPAYFSGGWQPEQGDWSAWVGGGSLVSVVLGKPRPLSGWDMAANQPKPLRHYVPAGSVFFFEDADISGIPFTETPPDSLDHGAIGFGTFAVGTW